MFSSEIRKKSRNRIRLITIIILMLGLSSVLHSESIMPTVDIKCNLQLFDKEVDYDLSILVDSVPNIWDSIVTDTALHVLDFLEWNSFANVLDSSDDNCLLELYLIDSCIQGFPDYCSIKLKLVFWFNRQRYDLDSKLDVGLYNSGENMPSELGDEFKLIERIRNKVSNSFNKEDYKRDFSSEILSHISLTDSLIVYDDTLTKKITLNLPHDKIKPDVNKTKVKIKFDYLGKLGIIDLQYPAEADSNMISVIFFFGRHDAVNDVTNYSQIFKLLKERDSSSTEVHLFDYVQDITIGDRVESHVTSVPIDSTISTNGF